jgi:hypothetical protein
MQWSKRQACAHRLHGGNGVAERYDVPMAITEVHLGCTREEQLRWFCEAWDTARKMAEQGMPIFAVTAWAAFGAMDWDSLLTRPRGRYEAGLFDGGRPTARSRASGASCCRCWRTRSSDTWRRHRGARKPPHAK